MQTPNEQRLQELMDATTINDNGWIKAIPQPEEDQLDDSICLHCAITELQEAQNKLLQSNEDLATEVWALKGTIDFMLKIIQGK